VLARCDMSPRYMKSVGIMTFPIYGKIEKMVQTTNQYIYIPEKNNKKM